MKQLGKLKLNQLSKEELNKREMNRITGGAPGECCICQYGGTNHVANDAEGLYSPSLIGSYTLMH
ncbi:MAG: TIGR04149 family rSAM-modified RiPP [Tannerellaceae bacterium]|jgi:natural product precursor|nr:TIGR04149 family rSAM-modified RiPP [Tannerellaceae bacterium]